MDRDPRVDLPRVRRAGSRPVCVGDAAFGVFAACEPAPASEKPTISAPPPLTNDLRENSLFEHLGHGYFPPFAITAAAFWIAVRIRG